jgi:histidine triad (HIT) family protein
MESDPNGCMGCRTAAGGSAADEVYRDERVVVVVAQHAVNAGHLVVVTLEHVRNALTMDEELLAHMMQVGREMGLLLRRAYDGCGVMLAINNEAPCQSLYHAHLHVVPRMDGDEMDHLFGAAVAPAERAEVAAFLRGDTVADGLD